MGMSVLTHDEILRLIREGLLSIEPFSEDIVRENGLDLRVGTEYAIYAFENNSGNYIVLRPGMRFLHVVLVKTIGEAKYVGRYLGQRGVTPPKGMKNEC
jgi:deoxycytidine triphosphate deaminase